MVGAAHNNLRRKASQYYCVSSAGVIFVRLVAWVGKGSGEKGPPALDTQTHSTAALLN
jgi:hypothetical protein